MSTAEFISAFELQYNFILSNAAPSLDLFEMSRFLTLAQKDIVMEIYNGSLSGSAFEGEEDVRQYINHLIIDYRTSDEAIGDKLTDKSKLFSLPNDVWFRVLEWADYTTDSGICNSYINNVKIQPITYDDYHYIKRNPFKRQDKRRILRLDYNGNIIELISDYNIERYGLRYIKAPKPIILENLQQGLSIDGLSTITECELNPVIHETILKRAVELAKYAWEGSANSKV